MYVSMSTFCFLELEDFCNVQRRHLFVNFMLCCIYAVFFAVLCDKVALVDRMITSTFGDNVDVPSGRSSSSHHLYCSSSSFFALFFGVSFSFSFFVSFLTSFFTSFLESFFESFLSSFLSSFFAFLALSSFFTGVLAGVLTSFLTGVLAGFLGGVAVAYIRKLSCTIYRLYSNSTVYIH